MRVNAVSGSATDASSLLTRIRAEYRQMPGLSVTAAQASRLWHADRRSCEAVLQRLVNERFLTVTDDGRFVRAA